jgi:hypothetical protein
MFSVEFINRHQLSGVDHEDAAWTPILQEFATEAEAEQEKAWLEMEGSDTVYRVRPALRRRA